ncbi:hypothetical protein B0T26DRAFT_302904 [Lasiosphaeria miniovina]|uniref:Uncharacterized protein n=1 Tax=Lasiosphaeria miniovina TaxID=1954250 RepID=A0AA40AKX8_9PEZI|nr:uncharacterized protein B0T26DRAFT_302904 [Lasiosphaeria miniovina]KAK0717729.1 hypothetical protein B0T26DRAFT_302904 [Lasiosphaeria miniovina]
MIPPMSGVATVSPFFLMAQAPDGQPAAASLLLPRPTNEFYSLSASIRHYRRHPFLIMAAAVALLANFLPIIISNVAYRLQQTYVSYPVCARASIGILAIMIMALLASMLVRWPYLPVDPRTIAGSLHYVTNSEKPSAISQACRKPVASGARRARKKGRGAAVPILLWPISRTSRATPDVHMHTTFAR